MQGGLFILHKVYAGDGGEKLWLEEEERLLTVALVGSAARGGERRERRLAAEARRAGLQGAKDNTKNTE